MREDLADAKPMHPGPEVLVDLAEGSTVDTVWRQHLSRCRVCSDRVRELKEGLAALGSVRVPEPGDAYWEDFDSRLQERLGRGGRRPGVRPARWVAAVAAGFVVAVALSILWSVWRTPALPTEGWAQNLLPPTDEDAEYQFL